MMNVKCGGYHGDHFFFLPALAACIACSVFVTVNLRFWNDIISSSSIRFLSSSFFLSSACCFLRFSNFIWSWKKIVMRLLETGRFESKCLKHRCDHSKIKGWHMCKPLFQPLSALLPSPWPWLQTFVSSLLPSFGARSDAPVSSVHTSLVD